MNNNRLDFRNPTIIEATIECLRRQKETAKSGLLELLSSYEARTEIYTQHSDLPEIMADRIRAILAKLDE